MAITNNLRFLIICDNPAFFALLREYVKQTGYTLEMVKTGAQGFKTIIAERPDLVFLDMGISDIAGLL